jgi:DEAD/DEAH box helicase domain-containing protein
LQQFGRAGRRSDLAFAVLVAGSSPLDQYVVGHPEYVFGSPPEAGLINPDNLAILVAHLKCAAFELPFNAGEEFAPLGGELLELLAEDGILHRSGGRYYWMQESYPAEQVSLRSASTDNFVVIEKGVKPRVLGHVDRPSAPLMLHEEAIYLHQGQQYQVEEMDWEEKKAYVKAVNVDYYTDANLAIDLKVLESFAEHPAAGATRAHGEVAVTYLATIFKKIKLESRENVGWGKIHLPQEDMHTTAYWFSLNEEVTTAFSRGELETALWAVSHLMANVAPLFLMCDPRDVRAAPQVRSPFTDAPTLFLYDNIPGGVGFADRLYQVHDDLIAAAFELAARCPCSTGCPSCVGPQIGDGPEDPRAAAMQHLRGKSSALKLLLRLGASWKSNGVPVIGVA